MTLPVGVIYGLVALGVVICYLWFKDTANADDIKKVKVALPDRLSDAEFWLREEDIHCDAPVALCGKPDEIWQLKAGGLVPVDIKSRSRFVTYRSDVMQLSVYAYILKHGRGKTVANWGYVRVHTPKGARYIEVDLLSDKEIEATHAVGIALKTGRTEGRANGGRGLCTSCAYGKDCH